MLVSDVLRDKIRYLALCWPGWSGRRSRGGLTPAVLAFAADACSFAALGGQDLWVTGVRVAPAQIVVQGPGCNHMVEMVRAGDDEHRNGPKCASIGFAHDEYVGHL